MDVVLQAAIIGLLQGLTEFIPVSSSAHLELAPWIFGWEEDELIGSLAFDVFLHLGTLVALLVYFARDWCGTSAPRGRASASGASVGTPTAGSRGCSWRRRSRRRSSASRSRTSSARRSTATATPRASRSPASWWSAASSCGWPTASGAAAASSSEVSAPAALTIGFSQALALLPGISRSGATLTAGLALGLTRESAARFSFLLATPITLGAGLYGSRRLLTEAHTGIEWLAIAVGFAVAAISGLVAIGFLLSWLRRRSVTAFSLYRIGFAALVVVLVLIGH